MHTLLAEDVAEARDYETERHVGEQVSCYYPCRTVKLIELVCNGSERYGHDGGVQKAQEETDHARSKYDVQSPSLELERRWSRRRTCRSMAWP